VQSLGRGLAVIRAFNESSQALTLTEVAERTALTRAAARRFLLTLKDLGYVRVEGRTFSLTPRVLELGYAYLSTQQLPEMAEPHLKSLSVRLNESSSASVLDGDSVVYIARIAASRIMRVSISLGSRFPAHVTSMGRVLLAGLSTAEFKEYLRDVRLTAYTERTVTTKEGMTKEIDIVRRQGWAIVDGELEEGIRSAAAPIRDRNGRTVAAVNISTHASRTSLKVLKEDYLAALLETAEAIASDLQGSA